jgi:hypothetical protein
MILGGINIALLRFLLKHDLFPKTFIHFSQICSSAIFGIAFSIQSRYRINTERALAAKEPTGADRSG